MLILVIHGQSHKGNSYYITKKFLSNFKNANIKEYFMPDDMSKPCLGCNNCLNSNEKNCYAYQKTKKIYEDMTESDLIVFSTPTYCMNMPGQLKTFFDHFAFLWMCHRPNRIMFKKRAMIISTCNKKGANKTIKEIKNNLKWWGISNIFDCSVNLNNQNYQDFSKNIKLKIENKLRKISKRVTISNVKVNIKIKALFMINRFAIIRNNKKDYDYNYWKEEGWLNNKRPW